MNVSSCTFHGTAVILFGFKGEEAGFSAGDRASYVQVEFRTARRSMAMQCGKPGCRVSPKCTPCNPLRFDSPIRFVRLVKMDGGTFHTFTTTSSVCAVHMHWAGPGMKRRTRGASRQYPDNPRKCFKFESDWTTDTSDYRRMVKSRRGTKATACGRCITSSLRESFQHRKTFTSSHSITLSCKRFHS